MSKKNKEKRKQDGQQRPQVQHPQALPEPKRFSETSKQDVSDLGQKILESETRAKVPAAEKGTLPLPLEARKEHDAKKDSEDLSGYWFEVRDMHSRLCRLHENEEQRQRVVDKKEKELRDRDEVLASKEQDAQAKAETFKRKLDELLVIEKSLTSGEYADAVKSLLKTVSDTQVGYQQETEKVFQEIREAFKAESSVRRERAKLEADKELFEEDQAAFEKEKADTYGEHWRLELERKSDTLRRLEIQRVAFENELRRLQVQLNSINTAFGGADVADMPQLHTDIKTRVAELETELNERPRMEEVEHLQKQVEFLKNKVSAEQEAVREKELLELKRLVDNQDKYAIEINGYKNKVESAQVREEHLKRTIDDLKRTIEQLHGESTHRDSAFEFAKCCDDDRSSFQSKPLENSKPPARNLAELVGHIQYRMANSERPFYYDETTIRIFLAGLHMSPISILQGISGTGKTSLPREFAKALYMNEAYQGKDDEDHDGLPKAPYRICAVQSGWRDNMDLMGHYNSFENRYKETEFFKALYLANQPKYRDTLFFIILDEMNLSRPEHYFADFLSLLEQSPGEWFVNLPDTPAVACPKLVNGGRLQVPPNVRFIGTANHDETTLEFAPKTYDRSNVLELPRNHDGNPQGNPMIGNVNVSYSWLREQFEKSVKEHSQDVEKFNAFISSDGFRNLFQKQGIGIGNRFEDQAGNFIGVFRGADGKLADAVDHLVTSRLLRRMRDRYDLDRNAMEAFKTEYEKAFKTAFGDVAMPKASELFKEEIAKKGQK